MASAELIAAESEWRQQFATMRAALTNLNLPPLPKVAEKCVEEVDLEDYSSGTGSQDVWDFISDDEQDDSSSDFADDDAEAGAAGDASLNSPREWFFDRSVAIAVDTGLSPDVFQSQIMSLLASSRADNELQAQLTDLVGFDHLDFIIDLLSKRVGIVAASNAQNEHAASRQLLTKSEREAALRRQDLEHKSASLAPASKKEPQYPHVYRSYQAGNTLSFAGKKYGLPVGSERHQFEKYEEYSVPAGRKGTLGPGEKLVKITDLDGLCRNTFKGYKSLNRMQSLVFPVGYKTNENMLICAPTGAVR